MQNVSDAYTTIPQDTIQWGQPISVWTQPVGAFHIPPTIYPNYSYGNPNYPIDASIALINLPTNWSTLYCKTFSATWTWNVIVTTGFKPSFLTIYATYNNSLGYPMWSVGNYSAKSSSTMTLFQWYNSGGSWATALYTGISTINIIEIEDLTGVWYLEAAFVSFNANWFTVNFTTFPWGTHTFGYIAQ